MAKSQITKSKFISEEAIKAPLEVADNVDKLVASIEKLVKAGKKSNTILEASKNTKDLSKETNKLTDAQKELEKIDKRIAKEQAKGTEEVQRRTKELKKLQKENRDNLKEEIEREKAMDKSLGTEERLRASNKDLRAERRKLNIETEEGAKRLVEINDEIDANTQSLKSLSDSYTQQKMEIGDYRGQLEGLLVNFEELTGSEGGISSLFSTITGGLGAATKASLKFIATPLGAILAAIVAAVSALGAAFTSNIEGANLFNEVMSGIGDVLDFLLGRFAMVGNAIIKLLKGDFEGAADTATKAVTGLGDGMAEAYNSGVAYERLLRDIKKQTIENTTATAQLQAELDVLNQKAGDATISLREQNEAAIAAAAKQIELTDQNLKLLEMEQKEAQIAFDKAKKNRSEDLLDKEQALAEATAAVIEAEAEQTLALAENVTLRRQIRQDEGEQYLDFLIDNFDNVKTINERIIANEKKSLEERRNLLFQTSDLGKKAFEEQIALIQEFSDETINANELLAQTDSRALFESVQALGMSEILNQRLLEVIRERRTAVKDLEESYRDLQDSQKQLNELEPVSPEIDMPELPDTLPKIKQQLSDEEQAILDSYNRRQEAAANLQDGLNMLMNEGLSRTYDIVSQLNQQTIDFATTQLEDLENRREYELSQAGRNAEERAEIERRFRREEERIEQERAESQRRQAVADKAFAITNAIISTAQGVAKALELGPIVGIPLSVIIGALGAAQVGIIASQPIPQFAKGTDNSPEGLAVVNEEGGELMERNGKYSMVDSDGAALTYLKKGTKIHTAKETQNILASGLTGGISVKKEKEINRDSLMGKRLAAIEKAIKNQKQPVINMSKGTVEYAIRNGQNITKLLNTDFR